MSPKVLMIDDSVPLHGLVASQVTAEGWQFHSAFAGVTGLSMASLIRPSLILLDIDMPDMDGFEVCKKLKQSPVTASIPVLYLSAESGTNQKVRGFDLGACDYVTKPFQLDELTARMRATIREGRQLARGAGVDPETGLWNEPFLNEHVRSQIALAERLKLPLSCVEIDIDGLNLANVRHGRPFGDEVIRTVASLLLVRCRAGDAVCSYGGGRFCAVMLGTDRHEALHFAERIAERVRGHVFLNQGKPFPMTCSFGIADSEVTGEGKLLDRAHAALVRAKESGGGKISVARAARKTTCAA